MSRFDRPSFDVSELTKLTSEEARNRLLFDWWCDEGEREGEGDRFRESDRLRYIGSLNRKPTPFMSRAPVQDDPAPPLTVPVEQGFRAAFLLSDPAHLRRALTEPQIFSNRPYAALGGGSFLLGLDPPSPGSGETDWHAKQMELVTAALGGYCLEGQRQLAQRAVEQAALTSLARPDFDLSQFAEQAALRYFGHLFGFGFQDHGVLEDASRATYRALQYLAIGKHFVTEPGTLPAAQQALGRLVERSSRLMDEYATITRAPRRYGWVPGRAWPEGVLPWSELDVCRGLGEPVLKRLAGLSSDLSGRDRATVAATLVAGTVGNIQSAVCLLVRSLLTGRVDELQALRGWEPVDSLEAELRGRLLQLPPLPVIPRRTLKEVELDGVTIPANTDCLLLLEGQPACPHVWGAVSREPPPQATHECMGQGLSMPLIAAIVRHTLRLKGLKRALDPLTGEALRLEKLWGFSCTRYPLRFERERQRAQQNLIVSMRVKAPISENAMRLRRLIAGGAPRIEHVLRGFGGVHFAWFEFTDDDTRLVLRTLYDGQFDAYVEYFALNAGDLFDHLFEYIEDAPPRPVAEHPQAFVETLRRNNRSPLAGYLFSAYPAATTAQIAKASKDWGR